MVSCSRCGQQVDETVRDTCPLCFTPLQPQANAPQAQPGAAQYVGLAGAPLRQAQPLGGPSQYQPDAPPGGAPPQPSAMPLNAEQIGAQPAAMPRNAPSAAPLRAPNTRMSLNGDIIDTPQNQAQSAPSIGNSPANRPAAPRPAYGVAPRKQEAPGTAARATALRVVAVLVVLGLAGFGRWYYMMHRTNPKDQATKYLAAIKTQDWATIYDITEQTEQNKAKFKDAQDFAAQTKSAIDKSSFGTLLTTALSSATFEAQDAKENNGSTAVVPIKVSGSALGQTFNQSVDLKMKNFDGIWKISTDNKGMGGMSGLTGGSFGSAGGGR